MAQGINLLQQEKEGLRLLNLAHLLKVGSLVFLIFYALLTLAIFSFSVYLVKTSQKVARETEIKTQKIAELKKVESLQVVFKQRLSSLNKLMTEKKVNYQGLLEEIERTLEPGVAIEKMGLTSAGSLTIEGTAPSSPALARFLDRLTGEKPVFSTITLSSIVRQKDGSYLFNINLTSE
jgi:Tfp pilus assembly protein PilN